ncbi:DUF3604 domain-containing protein [bacterium]|nr:DUF3604 domain-containing protein [bacterium]
MDKTLGTLKVWPERNVQVGETFDIKLQYKVGEQSILSSETFIIEWRENRFIKTQTKDSELPGFIESSTNASAKIKVEPCWENYSQYLHSQTHGIAITVIEGKLEKGDVVLLVIHKPETWAPFHMSTLPFPIRINFFVRFKIDGKIEYLDAGASINIISGHPEKLKIIATSKQDLNKPINLSIQALDRWNNIASEYLWEIELKSDFGYNHKLKFTLSDKGKKEIKLPINKKGVHYFKAEDKKRNFKATSNPVYIDNNKYYLYFGDIHGKVRFSHGVLGIDEYFRYGKDVSKLDFCATACMINWPVTGYSSKPEPPSYRDKNPLTDEDWQIIQEKTNYYNKPNEFITFLGQEWQRRREECKVGCPNCNELKSESFGDLNSYYSADKAPLLRPSNPKTCSPERLLSSLKNKDVLVIPHHSSAPAYTGAYTNWEKIPTDDIRLVEICSKWGVSEYEGNFRAIADYSKGHFVQDALRLGFRTGFIGSSDTHFGMPGSIIQEQPPQLCYANSGLACVYAEELTRGSVFQALQARRCYATTGVRMIIDFSINGHKMGEEFNLKEKEVRNIKIFTAGTNRIERIILVRNGEDFKTFVPKKDEYVCEFEFEDNSNLNSIAINAKDHSFVYYYVRVIQADWERGWSSPVWIDIE